MINKTLREIVVPNQLPEYRLWDEGVCSTVSPTVYVPEAQTNQSRVKPVKQMMIVLFVQECLHMLQLGAGNQVLKLGCWTTDIF